jgi:hypothetical protein
VPDRGGVALGEAGLRASIAIESPAMLDPTDVYVQAFTEAIKQSTAYSGLSISFALAAWLGGNARAENAVTVPGVPVSLPPKTAQQVLIAFAIGLGTMGLVAVDAAIRSSTFLQRYPDILAAACTTPGIASTSIGLRVGSAVLPLLLLCHVNWRHRKSVNTNWLILTTTWTVLAFSALAIGLLRVKCRDV